MARVTAKLRFQNAELGGLPSAFEHEVLKTLATIAGGDTAPGDVEVTTVLNSKELH